MSAAATSASRGWGAAPAARARIVLGLLGLLVLLAGCASTPRENLYTLSAVAPQRAGGASQDSGIVVLVESANVPELVDRPQFVISAGDSRMSLLEQQRWAEPLKSQIARTVALNLGRLLGSSRVSTKLLAGGGDAGYRVNLDVQRFESRPGDAVSLEVLWTVRRGMAPEVTSGRSIVREAALAPGYDALVAAHDRALATISGEIAAAIRK